MALYQVSGCQERRAKRGSRQQPTRSRYCIGRRISQGIYCEGMKVCQKAGCTSRSRHKQTSKWGCGSTFRASSSVKRSCSLCSTSRVSTLPNPRAHVNPRRLCSARLRPGSAMRCTPMKYTPMRCTPMKCTAHEMHAREVHAHETLTNIGAVVDLSRSELPKTSFCTSCRWSLSPALVTNAPCDPWATTPRV